MLQVCMGIQPQRWRERCASFVVRFREQALGRPVRPGCHTYHGSRSSGGCSSRGGSSTTTTSSSASSSSRPDTASPPPNTSLPHLQHGVIEHSREHLPHRHAEPQPAAGGVQAASDGLHRQGRANSETSSRESKTGYVHTAATPAHRHPGTVCTCLPLLATIAAAAAAAVAAPAAAAYLLNGRNDDHACARQHGGAGKVEGARQRHAQQRRLHQRYAQRDEQGAQLDCRVAWGQGGARADRCPVVEGCQGLGMTSQYMRGRLLPQTHPSPALPPRARRRKARDKGEF